MTDSENRVKLYEAIASNDPERWTKGNFIEYDYDENDNSQAFYCDIGWALVKAGVSEEELFKIDASDTLKAAELYGVSPDVIANVTTFNDDAPDFETNLEVVKAYLVEGSYYKARDIVYDMQDEDEDDE